ncbi:hypothetical protein O6P43_022955 [Quillaja saponaria]|uniref:Uncharacterized protein n=1 Tax=Quillaja saponaria TaxID=32244 RepID=A0AAD7LE83_QUISA|nr:hypothetical protein O6P43_022955 [Quillaja saponaria]
MFILLRLRFTSGLPVDENKVLTMMNVDDEVVYDGVPAVAEAGNTMRLGGRKIMSQRVLKEGKYYEHLINVVEDSNSKKISSTGAAPHSGRRRGHRRRVNHVQMAGFVAINADYHVPKPHPPKNN